MKEFEEMEKSEHPIHIAAVENAPQGTKVTQSTTEEELDVKVSFKTKVAILVGSSVC